MAAVVEEQRVVGFAIEEEALDLQERVGAPSVREQLDLSRIEDPDRRMGQRLLKADMS